MAAALEGDQIAFGGLVRRYERPVYSLVLRMVRDPGLAEDLTQDAFLKAFRALASYEPSRKFSSWLFKIAHNTTIDHLRRKRADTVALDATSDDQVDLTEILADPRAVSPHMRAEAAGVAAALERAVGRLREDYREIVLLRFGQGLAYHEIADVTDQPIGTIKTHIHRARKQLIRLLEEEGFKPDS